MATKERGEWSLMNWRGEDEEWGRGTEVAEEKWHRKRERQLEVGT
jgi:hypothetical protein